VRLLELFKLFGSIFIENNEANQALDDTESRAGKTGGAFGKLGGAATALGGIMAGALAAGIGAAVAGMGAFFVAGDNMQRALNGLQASTGATEEEMKGMEESLKNIYKNNYGESFEDIANSMANVKQTTGLAGAELESLTQNALILRDTFEFDVAESTRAADTLMKQFGITGEEAMTLIAQGAQQGADRNGDLLDTINEYAPQFQAIGLDAEFFLDTLITGAQNGAFSIDKVGDAVKEMNIRMKDGNDATKEALTNIGLNAEEITTAFAKGGEAGEQAFIDVVNALANVDDPLKKNIAGVAIMGTQYEDLEGKAIDALADIGFHTNKAGDTLEEINAIKYDSLGEAIQGIGRNLLIGVFEPFQQKVMPIVNEFANWISSKMPVVEEITNKTFTAIFDVTGKVWAFLKDNVIPIFDQWFGQGNENLPLVKALFENVFNAIKTVANTVWTFFKGNILPIFISLYTWIQGNMPTIRETVSQVFGKIKEVVSGVWVFFKDNILPILARLFQYIQEKMPQIQRIVETAFLIIKNVIEIVWDIIENLLLPVLIALWEWVSPYIPKIQKAIETAFDAIFDAVDAVVGVFETVTGAIQKAVDWLDRWNNRDAKKKTIEVEERRYTSRGGSITGGFDRNATGTNYFRGGTTLVGEMGPELVALPQGSKINPANVTRNKLNNNEPMELKITPAPVIIDKRVLGEVMFEVLDQQLERRKQINARAKGVILT
jgi:phage-related minor tail protein